MIKLDRRPFFDGHPVRFDEQPMEIIQVPLEDILPLIEALELGEKLPCWESDDNLFSSFQSQEGGWVSVTLPRWIEATNG